VITYVRGNIFESPAHVLVNTVNTEGVMGKGIALRFKQIYPEMFREYRDLCERHQLEIGRLHLYKTPRKWILNFPTKKRWRQPSRVEYVQAGLETFKKIYAEAGIDSIAFPPLGCGNGQLDFPTQVKPLMEKWLDPLPIPVFVYPERRLAGVPEHEDVENMRAWLRSEAESLPFDEVWRDVVEMVKSHGRFKTATKGREFEATAEIEPPSIAFHAAGKTYKLSYEDLLDFWQQLRQHGLVSRRIAPEHFRVHYLMPIFEQLPYVQRIEVSDTEGNAGVALQVRPRPARGTRVDYGDLLVPRV